MKAWHIAAVTTLSLTIGTAARAECSGEHAAMTMAMATPGTGAVATNRIALNKIATNKPAVNKLSANSIALNKAAAGDGAVAEVSAIRLPDGTRVSR